MLQPHGSARCASDAALPLWIAWVERMALVLFAMRIQGLSPGLNVETRVCIGCGVRIQRPEQLLSEARLPAIGNYRSRLDDNYWTAKVSDKCRSQQPFQRIADLIAVDVRHCTGFLGLQSGRSDSGVFPSLHSHVGRSCLFWQ